jgi:hypothetical protein
LLQGFKFTGQTLRLSISRRRNCAADHAAI